MMNCFRKIIYLIVLIGHSFSSAGSYDDFFTAIKKDDSQALAALLHRGFDVNTLNPEGEHGLYLALRERSANAASLLLRWPKVDINSRSQNDETPLMMACIKGLTQVAKELIDKGADVNKPGWTPLHYAATRGDTELMNILLENHAYIDAESPNGSTPLMLAAMYGTSHAVKLLLEADADPFLKNQQGLFASDFARIAMRTDSEAIIAAFVRARPASARP
jgi:ankyrin repeat protein